MYHISVNRQYQTQWCTDPKRAGCFRSCLTLCPTFKRISLYFSLTNLWEHMKNKLGQISTVVLWTHRHAHTHKVYCTNTAVPALLWVGGLGWSRGCWSCDLQSGAIPEISLTVVLVTVHRLSLLHKLKGSSVPQYKLLVEVSF